jgi:hypothetical protein
MTVIHKTKLFSGLIWFLGERERALDKVVAGKRERERVGFSGKLVKWEQPAE